MGLLMERDNYNLWETKDVNGVLTSVWQIGNTTCVRLPAALLLN